jgi:hypothetical protein
MGMITLDSEKASPSLYRNRKASFAAGAHTVKEQPPARVLVWV